MSAILKYSVPGFGFNGEGFAKCETLYKWKIEIGEEIPSELGGLKGKKRIEITIEDREGE